MSLVHNSNYCFLAASQVVLDFIRDNGLDLFSVPDMLQSASPNDSFVKTYANFPNKGVVVHRPVCPDKALVSGIGEATDSGFWVGMFKRDTIEAAFGSPTAFTDALGTALGLSNNSGCKRCGP